MFWKRKKKKIIEEENIYTPDYSITFDEWLNGILKTFDIKSAAFNFNIYENITDDFSAEFIAASTFDEEDEDWACEEVYASRNDDNEFYFKAKDLDEAEEFVQNSITEYLKNGEYSYKLKDSAAVACGHVNGNLTILYKK